jgi:hypothetical protein
VGGRHARGGGGDDSKACRGGGYDGGVREVDLAGDDNGAIDARSSGTSVCLDVVSRRRWEVGGHRHWVAAGASAGVDVAQRVEGLLGVLLVALHVGGASAGRRLGDGARRGAPTTRG